MSLFADTCGADNMIEQFHPTLVGIALALALGMLIGSEREWQEAKPIGMRTFSLLAGIGAAAGLLAHRYGGWLIAATLFGVTLLVASHLYRIYRGRPEVGRGMTTATAAVLTVLVGSLSVSGLWLEAVFLAASTLLLLHWKRALHQWVDRLGPEEFEAIARFILIALVILPLLPDAAYGPFGIFNPFRSWLLVVLVVGINIVGYLLLRFARTAIGLWLAGAIGGLISSTATTISYSSLSREKQGFGAAAMLVILVASAVVYARVLLELAVVAPALLRNAAPPLLAHAGFMLLLALLVHRRVRDGAVEVPEHSNPARLSMALTVGVVYVVVLFAVAIARDRLGEQAIYAVAALSGLTDVDALTLSVAQLHAGGQVRADTAWRAIFLATLANLAFKTGVAATLGSRELRRWVLPMGGGAVAVGIFLLLAWP